MQAYCERMHAHGYPPTHRNHSTPKAPPPRSGYSTPSFSSDRAHQKRNPSNYVHTSLHNHGVSAQASRGSFFCPSGLVISMISQMSVFCPSGSCSSGSFGSSPSRGICASVPSDHQTSAQPNTPCLRLRVTREIDCTTPGVPERASI